MHGENGTPVTPEWHTSPGNTCGSCASNANACHSLTLLPDHRPCCPMCTHCVVVEPLVWEGSD